ncbi:Uncharacterised protein [uncultured archaeon]|nr:Uncharacterised protein [uncultured archaeon]
MKKNILLIILLFLVPLGQAISEPLVTSYWGYVTVDGITKPNASVTVLDSSCNVVASATSTQDSTYLVKVPLDQGLASGETLTFNVDDKTAKTLTVGGKGTNNRLDLAVSGSSTNTCTVGGGGSVNGGSGGGASISAESSDNIIKKEVREEVLSINVPRSFRFTTPELPVSEVAVTSNINAGLINVQVELLKSRSTLVKDDAPGDVYKYVNIWVGTSGFAVPKNIKEAVIKFKLENSWLTSKGFKESDIAMLRWDGTQWISLATEKKNSDETFTYYEAKTNAFSPFAISGVKGTVPAAGAEVTNQTQTPAPAATKKAPGLEFVLAIAGLMAVVLRKRSK